MLTISSTLGTLDAHRLGPVLGFRVQGFGLDTHWTHTGRRQWTNKTRDEVNFYPIFPSLQFPTCRFYPTGEGQFWGLGFRTGQAVDSGQTNPARCAVWIRMFGLTLKETGSVPMGWRA